MVVSLHHKKQYFDGTSGQVLKKAFSEYPSKHLPIQSQQQKRQKKV